MILKLILTLFFEKFREDSIDQEGDDGEGSSAPKDLKDLDKFGRETPADSPSISSKADTPQPEAGGSHDGADILLDDDKTWPSVVDLNTRLRRVISSYQRSVGKKEEINKNMPKGGKPAMEIEMTNQAGTNTGEPPLNMQGWDLQQLAMYLLVCDGYFKIKIQKGQCASLPGYILN